MRASTWIRFAGAVALAGCSFDSRPAGTLTGATPQTSEWKPSEVAGAAAVRTPLDAGTRNATRASASSSSTATAAGSRVPSSLAASDAAVATPMSPPDSAALSHVEVVDDSDAGASVGKSDAGIAPPRPDAGSVAEPKTGAPAASETLPRQLASAVEAVFAGAGGVARGSNAEWKRWRNMARHSDRLTPEIVTPALQALASSAVCFARVSQCVDVCVVIEQDCEPCVEDPGCHAALRQVCGAFPGGFCTF